jgi:hypothetical protein
MEIQPYRDNPHRDSVYLELDLTTSRGSWLGGAPGRIRTRRSPGRIDVEGVARPAGFEPATYGFEVRCAIQLRHGRAVGNSTEGESGLPACAEFREAVEVNTD